MNSDYLSATNAETFGAAAAGPVNIPFGGIGEDVLDFGGDTVISGAEGTDTITFNIRIKSRMMKRVTTPLVLDRL